MRGAEGRVGCYHTPPLLPEEGVRHRGGEAASGAERSGSRPSVDVDEGGRRHPSRVPARNVRRVKRRPSHSQLPSPGWACSDRGTETRAPSGPRSAGAACRCERGAAVRGRAREWLPSPAQRSRHGRSVVPLRPPLCCGDGLRIGGGTGVLCSGGVPGGEKTARRQRVRVRSVNLLCVPSAARRRGTRR